MRKGEKGPTVLIEFFMMAAMLRNQDLVLFFMGFHDRHWLGKIVFTFDTSSLIREFKVPRLPWLQS
jgi:hypothetical protein